MHLHSSTVTASADVDACVKGLVGSKIQLSVFQIISSSVPVSCNKTHFISYDEQGLMSVFCVLTVSNLSITSIRGCLGSKVSDSPTELTLERIASCWLSLDFSPFMPDLTL